MPTPKEIAAAAMPRRANRAPRSPVDPGLGASAMPLATARAMPALRRVLVTVGTAAVCQSPVGGRFSRGQSPSVAKSNRANCGRRWVRTVWAVRTAPAALVSSLQMPARDVHSGLSIGGQRCSGGQSRRGPTTALSNDTWRDGIRATDRHGGLHAYTRKGRCLPGRDRARRGDAGSNCRCHGRDRALRPPTPRSTATTGGTPAGRAGFRSRASPRARTRRAPGSGRSAGRQRATGSGGRHTDVGHAADRRPGHGLPGRNRAAVHGAGRGRPRADHFSTRTVDDGCG